jgi:uncharacterized protein with HEPN domain
MNCKLCNNQIGKNDKNLCKQHFKDYRKQKYTYDCFVRMIEMVGEATEGIELSNDWKEDIKRYELEIATALENLSKY